MNINTIDSTQLAKILKPSNRLAGRIIRYRERLGGYVELKQLKEVYGLSSAQYELLQKSVYIQKNFEPRRLKLDTISFKTLIRHPYMNYEMSKLLLNFQKHCGENCNFESFKSLEQFDSSMNQLVKYYLD